MHSLIIKYIYIYTPKNVLCIKKKKIELIRILISKAGLKKKKTPFKSHYYNFNILKYEKRIFSRTQKTVEWFKFSKLLLYSNLVYLYYYYYASDILKLLIFGGTLVIQKLFVSDRYVFELLLCGYFLEKLYSYMVVN